MSAFGGKADITLALRTPDLGLRHDPDMDLAVMPETDKPLGSGIGRNAKHSSKLMNARKQDEGIDVGQYFQSTALHGAGGRLEIKGVPVCRPRWRSNDANSEHP